MSEQYHQPSSVEVAYYSRDNDDAVQVHLAPEMDELLQGGGGIAESSSVVHGGPSRNSKGVSGDVFGLGTTPPPQAEERRQRSDFVQPAPLTANRAPLTTGRIDPPQQQVQRAKRPRDLGPPGAVAPAPLPILVAAGNPGNASPLPQGGAPSPTFANREALPSANLNEAGQSDDKDRNDSLGKLPSNTFERNEKGKWKISTPLDPVPPLTLGLKEAAEEKYIFDTSSASEDRVGAGTYANVFKGRTNVPGAVRKKVALKRYKMLDEDKNARKDILDGSFPITTLREVHVLRVLKEQLSEDYKQFCCLPEDICWGKNGKDIYLVFPFIEHTLSGLGSLAPRSRPSDLEVAFLFKQLLTCLVGFQSLGFIHRDLKLNNILVGSDGQLRICDFGLAVSGSIGRSRLTPNVVVTIYRPPEMLLGCKTYTNAVDIWCVGCMLAEYYLGPSSGIKPFLDKGSADDWLFQLQAICSAISPLSHFPTHLRSKADRSKWEAASRSATEKKWPTVSKGFKHWFKDKLAQIPDYKKGPPPSQAAMKAMEAMLVIDPEERTSPSKILQLDFFREITPQTEKKIKSELVAKLTALGDASCHDLVIHRERERQKQQQANRQ